MMQFPRNTIASISLLLGASYFNLSKSFQAYQRQRRKSQKYKSEFNYIDQLVSCKLFYYDVCFKSHII